MAGGDASRTEAMTITSEYSLIPVRLHPMLRNELPYLPSSCLRAGASAFHRPD